MIRCYSIGSEKMVYQCCDCTHTFEKCFQYPSGQCPCCQSKNIKIKGEENGNRVEVQ